MENSVIDLIIRIKNGYLSRKEVVESPHSVYKEEVVKKLARLKYIKTYKVEGDTIKKIIMKQPGFPSMPH